MLSEVVQHGSSALVEVTKIPNFQAAAKVQMI